MILLFPLYSLAIILDPSLYCHYIHDVNTPFWSNSTFRCLHHLQSIILRHHLPIIFNSRRIFAYYPILGPPNPHTYTWDFNPHKSQTIAAHPAYFILILTITLRYPFPPKLLLLIYCHTFKLNQTFSYLRYS